jgi:hypothetical protein
MRVAGPVGEGVVAAVDGDPADDLALEAHRPRDRQRDAQRRDRGEAAMSQQAVKAHGHPEPGDHVESQREQDIGEVQAVAPGQPDRRRQPGERHDNERDRHAGPGPALDGARRPAAHGERHHPVVGRRRDLIYHDHSYVQRGDPRGAMPGHGNHDPAEPARLVMLSQPRRRHGGNGLQEIGPSPEPISRRLRGAGRPAPPPAAQRGVIGCGDEPFLDRLFPERHGQG